jgi:hypothetical protein
MTTADIAYVRYLRDKPERVPMIDSDRGYYAMLAIRECGKRGGHLWRKLYTTMDIRRCRYCGLEVFA